MCYVARCALDRDANAVGIGRRFIAAQLARCGLVPSDGTVAYLDDVLLATSELLANAVKFGMASSTCACRSTETRSTFRSPTTTRLRRRGVPRKYLTRTDEGWH